MIYPAVDVRNTRGSLWYHTFIAERKDHEDSGLNELAFDAQVDPDVVHDGLKRQMSALNFEGAGVMVTPS